jgi:hypothetical protein
MGTGDPYVLHAVVVDPVTFWYGSGSQDPYHWLMDPDPALFFSSFQNANKSFSLIIFRRYIYISLPSHESNEEQQTKFSYSYWQIKVYQVPVRKKEEKV